jgi:hypothetical protein
MNPDDLALAARVESRQDDPIRIAAYYDVRVYLVPCHRLHFRGGQYMRIGGQPVIHVDDQLRGTAKRAVVGHELAHHLIWWHCISVDDEELYCDAVARSWTSPVIRIAPAAVRLVQHPKAVQSHHAAEIVEPLRYGLVAASTVAA